MGANDQVPTQSRTPATAIPIPPPLHRFPFSAVAAFGRDPLAFDGALAAQGPLARTSLAGRKVLMVSEPELLRELLMARAGELKKLDVAPRIKLMLGGGLINADGDAHRARRRMVMPAFHRQAIAQYAGVIVELTQALRESWKDGQSLDLADTLNRLALDVTLRCLYGTDLGDNLGRMQRAMAVFGRHFSISTPPWLDAIKLRLPLPSTLETRRAINEMDAVFNEMLERRRTETRTGMDLLRMLMEARDEAGAALDARELRDEAMTLLMAAHDSLGVALTWSVALLVQHPEIRDALRNELAAVLGDRLPGWEDYPKLGFVERVFSEALRLYPPGWILARTPRQAFDFAGHRVSKGTLLVMSPYWLHRDPRHFPDPERFDPGRFLPAAKEARKPFTYLPFSAGPRSCLGEGLAWMQGVLILATLCQRWRFEAPAGQTLDLTPVPKFLLVPAKAWQVQAKDA